MSDEDEQLDEQPENGQGPIEQIQSILNAVDPDGGMCLSFALVCEWIEQDGSQSMSLIHTEMTPWHLFGLLTYGRNYHLAGATMMTGLGEFDEED